MGSIKTNLYQRLAAKHAAILAELELLAAKRSAQPAFALEGSKSAGPATDALG